MKDEKLERVLPLMFRQIKIPEGAKAKLKARLFGNYELTDDDIEFVAAAGDLTEREQKTTNKINGGKPQ